jgi:hypothetical protein
LRQQKCAVAAAKPKPIEKQAFGAAPHGNRRLCAVTIDLRSSFSMSSFHLLRHTVSFSFLSCGLASACGGEVPAAQDRGPDSGPDSGDACSLEFGVPEARSVIEGVPSGLIADGSYIYWTVATGLQRVPTQGGNVETIATGMGMRGLVAASPDILWTEQSSTGYAIRRWTTNGGAPVSVLDGWVNPINSVAATSTDIYWLDLP